MWCLPSLHWNTLQFTYKYNRLRVLLALVMNNMMLTIYLCIILQQLDPLYPHRNSTIAKRKVYLYKTKGDPLKVKSVVCKRTFSRDQMHALLARQMSTYYLKFSNSVRGAEDTLRGICSKFCRLFIHGLSKQFLETLNNLRNKAGDLRNYQTGI